MGTTTQADRLSGIRDVRGHLAGGMLITGAFQVGLLGLTALRGVAAAAFVSRTDYGLWGLIGLTLWTALGLKSVFGAGEKYVQQSDENQEHAFQRGFTIELIFTAAMLPIAVGAVFGVAAVSGNSGVIAPGLALLLLLPATALQFPISVYYRRLEFRRQRTLQAIDPVVSAVAIIALAVAGAGYWSFVLGTLCGSWALALVLLRLSPYRLALRYERGTLRQYLAFSLPLLVTGIAVLALFYVIYLVGNAAIGIAGLGAFTLAGNLVQFTDQADGIITETLYPAVCAVQERVSLLSEIFVKSNRLSLIWAVPFGVGIALFASDLVRLVLGSQWLPAVPVLEIIGVVTAVHHVAYNWSAFVKARGKTWPIAVEAVLTASVVIGAGIPLMYSDHLVGLGIAFALGEIAAVAVRAFWLRRFFTGVSMFRHLARAFMPTAIAVIPVLALRAAYGVERSLPSAIAVFALYVAATVAATLTLERPLLREALGYALRRRRPQPAGGAPFRSPPARRPRHPRRSPVTRALRPAAIRRTAAQALPWLAAIVVILAVYFSPTHLVSVSTAITGLVGFGVIAVAARWPDRSLIALIVLLPFQGFILAKLWAWGMPTSIVRHAAAWKESLAIGVILAGIRSYLGSGRRADALDRIGLGFVAIVALYVLAQPAIAHAAPTSTSTRLLGFRQDAGFVLLLLGARHAPLPANFLDRAGRAALAVGLVVAGVCVFETIDSSAWNRFVVDTIQYTRYQIGVLHGSPPNPYDIRVYGSVGGVHIVRAGSVFLSALTTGFYLVLTFALALERVARRQSGRSMVLVLALAGAGILLTQTRSAILAALIVAWIGFRPAAGRSRHWRTQMALLVAALAIVAVPLASSIGLYNRVTAPTSNADNAGHISAFWSGLHTIEHHPLGTGLGTSAGVGQQFNSQASEVVIPENDYLQVGIELGVLPLTLFVALTGALVLDLRAAARRHPHAVVTAAWAAAAGLAVAAWFLQIWIDFAVGWTMWGLAGAALGASRAYAPVHVSETAPAGGAAPRREPLPA